MNKFFSRLLTGDFGEKAVLTSDREPPEKNLYDPDKPKRPKIGLALSSGAAKGLAHIGVIQVLEKHGIEIDAVAGSSMGAYVGALWCEGYHGKKLEDLAATIKTKKDIFSLLDPVFPPRRGFVRGEKVRQRLYQALGDRKFEDLDKKLLVVATELDHLSRKVFDKGPVVDAVHASIAIPGICEPVTIEGIDYTDGGVSDPMPVNILKRAGMDKVIAVCVLPTADELLFKKEKKKKREEVGIAAWFNHHFNYWSEGNIFNIQRSADFGMQMRLAELSMKEADVQIHPIICNAKWHDYAGYAKYIRLGREITESKIGEIKKLLEPKVLIND
ncbi:MAG: patatin-like phospholipase family protein [Verrucomicrobiales bacterium]|nr:patatin-like phospholipase family protein [Verrucomicrobiales bacterium]